MRAIPILPPSKRAAPAPAPAAPAPAPPANKPFALRPKSAAAPAPAPPANKPFALRPKSAAAPAPVAMAPAFEYSTAADVIASPPGVITAAPPPEISGPRRPASPYILPSDLPIITLYPVEDLYRVKEWCEPNSRAYWAVNSQIQVVKDRQERRLIEAMEKAAAATALRAQADLELVAVLKAIKLFLEERAP